MESPIAMRALAIVWDHWVREDVRARKEELRERRIAAAGAVVLDRLHVENYYTYLEVWRSGIDDEMIVESLKQEARWMCERRSVDSVCMACTSSVARFTHFYDGVVSFCEGCQSYQHVFIGLFQL